jgi:C4-dicarboxylate-specific signal transduction histidine kinase
MASGVSLNRMHVPAPWVHVPAAPPSRDRPLAGSADDGHRQWQGAGGFGALTAAIVHEVNQPLSGIATNAGACLRMLCADPPNVEGARETALRTLRDVDRVVAVIGRMRALFTDHACPTGSVDLNAAVRDVLAGLGEDLRSGEVTVRQLLADRLLLVTGDRIQLEQVIHNLVRNAIEAMADVGHPRVRTLTVATRRLRDGTALLTVHDVGVGVAEHDRHAVFKPFHSTKPGGMGIGLCISRTVVERHGGRLWMTSNDGPGVTVWMAIPRARLRGARGAATVPCADSGLSSPDGERPDDGLRGPLEGAARAG